MAAQVKKSAAGGRGHVKRASRRHRQQVSSPRMASEAEVSTKDADFECPTGVTEYTYGADGSLLTPRNHGFENFVNVLSRLRALGARYESYADLRDAVKEIVALVTSVGKDDVFAAIRYLEQQEQGGQSRKRV